MKIGDRAEYWSYHWHHWMRGKVIEVRSNVCTPNQVRICLDNGYVTTWYQETSTTIRPMNAIERLGEICPHE